MTSSTYNWLTLLAIVVGPIIAVLISIGLESRRRTREQRMVILKALLMTRHLVGDPNYSAAINLIPLEFAKEKSVIEAYRAFLAAANAVHTPETRERLAKDTGTKQTKLIFAIAKVMGFDIAETDIQTAGYAAEGWIDRDNAALDAQKATRDIANLLLLQSRLIANSKLNDYELALLGERNEGE